MLRPNQSLISLTSTDIADFEHRLLARRQYARFLQSQDPRVAGVRLSPGPDRHASINLVPKEQLTAEAMRSLSRAAARAEAQVGVVGGEFEKGEVDGEAEVRAGAISHGHPVVAQDREIFGASCVAHGESQGQQVTARPLRPALTDGSPDGPPPTTPVEHTDEPKRLPSRRGLEPLEEIVHDGYPSSAPRRPLPSQLPSARAPRRHARNQVTSVAEDGVAVQELIRARHLQPVPNHNTGGIIPPPPVPALMLPDNLHPGPDLRLHGAAPVFVPRTRFGTEADLSAESDALGPELRWSSLDSTHSNTNLRLRSSSEQNVEPSSHSRGSRREDLQPRHRRRSRASDQNEAMPNLERYPLLPPPPRHVARRRHSASQRAVQMPGRRVSRVLAPGSSSSPLPPVLSGISVTVEHSHSHLVPTMDGTTQSRAATASASTCSSFPSPPFEAPPGTRSSSLSWRGDTASPTSARRVPSMISAASGISGAASSQRASSDGTDAIAEFLRMRNSPLDELTKRLSRLSANRPISVDNSWERTAGPTPPVSLLPGDPFRQDSSSPPLRPPEEHVGTNVPSTAGGRHTVAVGSTALPSSPPRVPTSTVIASPSRQDMSSPRRPLKDMSPIKAAISPGSAIKSQSVASASITSRVKIYDDTKPATTQPQTPAELPRSSRRAHMRSDNAVHARQQPSVASSSTISLPQIPDRSINRHTYPSDPPESAGRTQIAQIDAVLGSVSRPRALRGTRTQQQQQRSTSEENDLDSQLLAVEGDRRTWLERREHGSLMDTPPAEGRYEQFLE